LQFFQFLLLLLLLLLLPALAATAAAFACKQNASKMGSHAFLTRLTEYVSNAVLWPALRARAGGRNPG